MASRDSAITRQILERGIIGQSADDISVGIRLKYVGKGKVTSVVTVSATSIVLTTTDGGVDTYAFATYTTLGDVQDAINADGIFEARILDALRSSASANSLLANGGATLTALGYYDILVDTSGANFMAYRISWDRFPDVNAKLRMLHRVHLQEIKYNVTLGGGADANGLRIYEYNPNGQVENLIYESLPVSGSLQTVNWAAGMGRITAQDNNDLVVILLD